jgi:hypothetical protein
VSLGIDAQVHDRWISTTAFSFPTDSNIAKIFGSQNPSSTYSALTWILLPSSDIALISEPRRLDPVQEDTVADQLELSADQVKSLNYFTFNGQTHSRGYRGERRSEHDLGGGVWLFSY